MQKHNRKNTQKIELFMRVLTLIIPGYNPTLIMPK